MKYKLEFTFEKLYNQYKVCIREQVTIGKNSLVGLGALVTKDIPDNEVWAGFPAKKVKDNHITDV